MIGSRDPGAWARLTALGMIWGGSFVATELALTGFGPFTVAAGRLALAAATLWVAARAMGSGLPRWHAPGGRRLWAFALAVALASNALPFILISWAQLHVDAGVAAIFMALLPLAVLPLSAALVPGEVMTRRKVAGFAIGVAGVILLIGPQALKGLGGAGLELLAEIACLGVVLLYAAGSVTAKRAPLTDPVGFGAAAMLLAAAATVPAALIVEQPWRAAPPGWPALAALVFLALLSTALAQVMLLQVLRRAGPPFLSMVNFMIPVWALIFAAILLGETPPPRAALALPLILLGVAIAQGPLGRRAPA